MDLISLEREKARAYDCVARGHLRDASGIFETLEVTFARFGHFEGLAAVRYNRLLLAVETDERAVIGRVALSLVSALDALEPASSPTVITIASGVHRLRASGVALFAPSLAATLTDCAARHASASSEPISATPRGAFPEATPNAIALLGADEAACILTTLSVPILSSSIDSPAAALAAREVRAQLQNWRVAAERGDSSWAYTSLVRIFEAAVPVAPDVAATCHFGLMDYERAGLSDRLDYNPDLIIERRWRASVELHGALARACVSRTGFERAARIQFAAVIEAAARVTERMKARRLRNVNIAEDAEIEVQLALWKCEAHQHLGEHTALAATLEPFISRAQRNAFTHGTVSVRVLLAAGQLAERAREGQRAAAHYREAAEVAMPGIGRAHRPLDLAAQIGDALADHDIERLPLAVLALAGLARALLPDGPASRLALSTAHTLVSLCRVYLPPNVALPAALVVELSAAKGGDILAADRAAELARILNAKAALSIALLYRATPGLQSPVLQTRRAACALLVEASAEAATTAAGAVRRALEARTAEAYRTVEDEGSSGRVDVHLRRYAEANATYAFAELAMDLDVFLPDGPTLAIDHLAPELISSGKGALLRDLCATERRRASASAVLVRDTALCTAASAYFFEDFDRVHRLGEPRLAPSADIVERLSTGRELDETRRTMLTADEAVLEFRVMPRGTLIFLRRAAGVTCVAIDDGTVALQGRVAELLRLVRGPDARPELFAVAQTLYQLLIRPFAPLLTDVKCLSVVPDGPLWALPFGVLLGENFLAERFSLSIARIPAVMSSVTSDPGRALAVVIGDAATDRDLRLGTLEGDDLYERVVVRSGEELGVESLHEAVSDARFLHVVGAVTAGPCVSLSDDDAALPVATLAEACRRGAVATALLHGPVEGPLGREAVSLLLGGVRHGVFARHWQVDEDGEFLLELARACAEARGPHDFAAALAATRCAAIKAGRPAKIWMAYELYVKEAV